MLGPIAHSIVPSEYRNQKDLVGLLMHTLSERNKYFSHVLGSDFESYQVILGAADKVVTDAVINLTKSESLRMEKAEDPDMIACLVCHERTPLPQKDPPWGSAVIYVNCHAPLVGQSQLKEEIPSYVSPQLLENLFGMTGRALEHPRCPFCKKINHAIVFPVRGLSVGWYAVRKPRDPACFSFMVHCIHYNMDFYVEWDENPLQATCRICGIQTEDPVYSRVICMDCATKASKLRYRMKLQQPPGDQVEYIFLVGFGRKPENADVSSFAASKIELAPHLYTLMLTGSMPQTAVEIGLVTAEVVARNGQEKLGHEVDWGKVTYEEFRDLLLIKFWE